MLDGPRFVFRQQISSSPPSGLFLEIDVAESLAVVVAHNEAGVLFFDKSRAAGSGGFSVIRPASAVA